MHLVVLFAIAGVGGGTGASLSFLSNCFTLLYFWIFGLMNLAILTSLKCIILTPSSFFSSGGALMNLWRLNV